MQIKSKCDFRQDSSQNGWFWKKKYILLIFPDGNGAESPFGPGGPWGPWGPGGPTLIAFIVSNTDSITEKVGQIL